MSFKVDEGPKGLRIDRAEKQNRLGVLEAGRPGRDRPMPVTTGAIMQMQLICSHSGRSIAQRIKGSERHGATQGNIKAPLNGSRSMCILAYQMHIQL